MPIPKHLRHLYSGPDWPAIRERILRRDRNRCQRCRKPVHEWIFTYTWKTQDPEFGGAWRYHMIWIREGSKVWRNQWGKPCSPRAAQGLPRKIRVNLTIVHRDHNPANNRDRNLAAWCTWCHLHHDEPHHRANRQLRKDRSRPILAANA
jgi:hypothetical protein